MTLLSVILMEKAPHAFIISLDLRVKFKIFSWDKN